MAPIQTRDVDTSNCETEPLRFPAAIQPHGALLVLQANSGVIEAASQTCAALLGAAAEDLLGQRASAILGAAAQASLLCNPGAGLAPLIQLPLNAADLRARASINQARKVLVDIEAEPGEFLSMRGSVYHRRQALKELRLLTEMPAIAQGSAALIREITGYDRVMLYRFDGSWNGEVIGEACIQGIESYLGLTFPDTDIPQQARDLLAASAVRMIPEALYAPSVLVAQGDAHAIDLGTSSLRSVSPMHIEYLRNMGVRATLVGSLIVEGRLWGLVACHHINGPKYLGPSVRDALGWLFEDIAALIAATLTALRRSREYSLATRRRRLVEAVRQGDLRSLMDPAHSADLLGVVAADGFALIGRDSIQATANTPAVDRIRTLQTRRRAAETTPTLFASSELTRDLGLEDCGDCVAGAVFVSLRDDAGDTLIWFRNEREFSVTWGGDPAHMRIADDAGRLSPRKSFVQFRQANSGHSLPWTTEELDSAAELGSLIEIEALREREAFAQTLVNSTPVQIAVMDTQGIVVSVNAAWRRFAALNSPGEPARDAVGLHYRTARAAAVGEPPAELASRAWAGIEGVLQGRLRDFTFHYPCHALDERCWLRMYVFPMLPPAEGVVVVHEDVSESVHTKIALERANERAALATRSGGIGIWDWNLTTDTMVWDQQMYGLYGMPAREEFGSSSHWLRCLHPEDRPTAMRLARAAIENGTGFESEFRVSWPDGTEHFIRGAGLPVRNAEGRTLRIVGSNWDITEPRRLAATLAEQHEELELYRQHLERLVAERTAELEQANAAAAAAHRASVERLNAEREAKIRSSKLEAVGTLAAGIAHDFNNILASIVANAEVAEDELPADCAARENVKLIIKGSYRARDLVARMLDFARERPGVPGPVNIILQVREALALLRASLPPSIELAFHSELSEATSTILADPTQIMQIVMNLCINAAHAMDEHGVIGVRVEPAHAVQGASRQHPDSLCLTVADTGSGMSPEVLERIFDPFFTTKAPGAGSGLGLSVVYGIVKNLGGVVEVQSSIVHAHSGTQFQVFLPLAHAA